MAIPISKKKSGKRGERLPGYDLIRYTKSNSEVAHNTKQKVYDENTWHTRHVHCQQCHVLAMNLCNAKQRNIAVL